MASPLLQGKLHISGMDSCAPALARQWQLGLETIAFSYAPLLDDPAALPRTREEIHGISSLWLHGPFAELIPCAIDPLARDVAMRRFRQALDAAQALGIRRMVFHGGFIPHVYFPEWYVEQSVWFWREFLRDVPADMTLALENVMEPSPETLVSIAAQIDDPRLGLCLDVGHANTCVSETPAHGLDRAYGPMAAAHSPAQQSGRYGPARPAGTGKHPHAADHRHGAASRAGGHIHH